MVRNRLAVLKTPVVLLVLSALPFLAYLVLHSLHDRSQALDTVSGKAMRPLRG